MTFSGFPGFAFGIIIRAGLVRMNRSGRNPFRDLGSTDDCPPVIEYLDQIVFYDIPGLGILGVDPDNPVIISVLLQDSVVLDFVQPAVL